MSHPVSRGHRSLGESTSSAAPNMSTKDPESRELLDRSTSPGTEQHAPAAMTKPKHQARWFTPEFLFYFAVLGFCYYTGSMLVWKLSEDATSLKYRHLHEGWMFGRLVDLSDGQYRFFRNQLHILVGLAVGFLVASHGVRIATKNSLTGRLWFYALFSFIFLLVANGSCVAFMLAIVSLNYGISILGTRQGMGRIAIMATWVFNCAILLLNERYSGYHWPDMVLPQTWAPDSLIELARWLERHRGMFPWHSLFNLVVLRMISFNLDRIWSWERRSITEKDGGVLTFQKHQVKCFECKVSTAPCTWWREKEHHALADYNPLTYFAYLFYVPLHFAGPTITFNSFLSHVKVPQQSYPRSGLAKYFFLKTLAIFLLLEFWLHHFYVFSFTNSKAFLSLTPYEMAMVSYYTLVAIWLKFTCIWRFFRCWSLLDGVEPPENMQRCVSNNYSIQSFWRAWHRSFNRWLVRYIYIPLGGGSGSGATAPTALATSPTSAAAGGSVSPATSEKPASTFLTKMRSVCRQSGNIFLTFSFVAFWHDRTMQLLAWGWLIALLFIPELAASAVFNLKSTRAIKQRWYWRHIRGVGAALSIFTMMVANLIGYSVGIHGTSSILHTIATEGGLSMAVVVFTAFFSAAMIMFECRDTGITVD